MNRARRAVRSRPPSSVGNRGTSVRGAPPGRGMAPTRGVRGGNIVGVRGSPSARRALSVRGVPRGPPGTRGTLARGMATRGRGLTTTPVVKSERDESLKDLTNDDDCDVVPQSKEVPTLCKISGIQNTTSAEAKNEPPSLNDQPVKSILKKEPVSALKTEPVLSLKTETVSPQKTETVSPQKTETVSPQKTEPVLSLKTEPVSPQKRDPVSPQKREPVSPQKTEPISPQKTEPISPQKTEPVSPQKTESVLSQKAESISTQNTESISSQNTESISSKNTESISSQNTESISLQKNESISLQKKDSNPNDESNASCFIKEYQNISPGESEKSTGEMDNADQNKSPNKGVTNGNENKDKESKEEEENEMETSDTEGRSRKRKSEGEKGFSPRKKRKSDHLVPKNPLMKLNELKPGLTYTIEKQEGPSHNPTFWVSVMVDGEKHIGKGRSKQDAKHSAALVALSSFVQFHNQSEVSQMMPQTFTSKTDFTTDEMEEEDLSFNVSAMKNKMKYSDYPQVFMPKRSRIQKALAGFESKSPVMLLNELHPGSEYTLIDEMSGIPAHRFMMAVNVNNTLYEGSGQSKKQAKAAAARVALVSIYHIPLTGNYSSMNTGASSNLTMSGLKQAVADKIASTVYETFSQIIVGFDDNKKWKVLSGIVMTTDEEMEKITVIGVSTGTKCISGEHISMNGAVLNDCHAEIISRRCFKNFLYSQLERYAEPDEDSNDTLDDLIIIKNVNGGFSLKPDVKFHLFISTAPCGDARIFSPHELEFGDKVDKHPNRKGRGLLRTKIEAGEGTIPVKSGEAIQTWDGIQGGQRLLTMSCSDKIARWNVLGIQGTLLSLYFEPIYLESIILGSMYHEDHMHRAIGKRIECTVGPLPDPYRLIIPKINIVTSTETRQASKSPTYSVNWSLGLANPEIVNGTTGKLHNGQLSRLAKRSFFARFQTIRSKLPILAGRDTKPTNIYAETKSSVADYQNAKEVVFKAFQDAGLGTWVKKPPEQDDFEVNF